MWLNVFETWIIQDKEDTAGFLRVLQFPLPIFIPPISPQSPSPIIRGWDNRPVSGRSTQSPNAQIKKEKYATWIETATSWFETTR
jgi:hypothetical protein